MYSFNLGVFCAYIVCNEHFIVFIFYVFTFILVHIIWSGSLDICNNFILDDDGLPKHVASLINMFLIVYSVGIL
jgi:hypothetical protein